MVTYSQILRYKEELTSLIENNYKQLYGMVYRMTENHQDTEDVLQNAFLKAYSNIGKFKSQSKLSTWVYKIVVNESYRHLKSWRKLPVLRITEREGITEETFFKGLEYEPTIDDELIMEEMREKCLHGFLKCIPHQMRVCFLLKNFLQLKNKEIAEIMELSENNVKISLYRARKKLKDMFEMRCNLIDPSKPCKCYLWIKFMRDHNLPLPTGSQQIKNDDLKQEHFRNMSLLRKIDYLYHVKESLTKEEFFNKLKKVAEIL